MSVHDAATLVFWLALGVVSVATVVAVARWRSGRPGYAVMAVGYAGVVAGGVMSELWHWIGWLLLSCVGIVIAVWDMGRGWPASWLFGVRPWDAYEAFRKADFGSMTFDQAAALLVTLEGGRVPAGDSELVALLREEYRDRLARTPDRRPAGLRSDWRMVRIHELAAARWPDRVQVDRPRAERRWRLLKAYRLLAGAAEAGGIEPAGLAAALADLPEIVDPEEVEMLAFLTSVARALEDGRPVPPEAQPDCSRDLKRRVWPRPGLFAGAHAGPWADTDEPTASGP